MEAIDEENKGMVGVVREKENAHITNNIQLPQQNLETSPLGIAVSSSQGSMGSQRSMSRRKFVDFSSSKKIEEQERVGRITKRRGQVSFILFRTLHESGHHMNQDNFLIRTLSLSGQY